MKIEDIKAVTIICPVCMHPTPWISSDYEAMTTRTVHANGVEHSMKYWGQESMREAFARARQVAATWEANQ